MTFKEQLEIALNNIQEGHHYLRKTGEDVERQINRANVNAMQSSGMPGYQAANDKRNSLLSQAQSKRPLRRSEFINLYGYDAWREYVMKHGLPENHKWADAE